MKVLAWSPSLKAREWIWRPWEEREREEHDLRAETNASSHSAWFWWCLALEKMRMKCCGGVGLVGVEVERCLRGKGSLSLRLAEMNMKMGG